MSVRVRHRLTALVLCGGAGERLGGVQKPLQPFAGRPLIAHVVEALRPQAGSVIVSANREASRYARYANTVVEDGAYRGCGPLAGFAAGLAAARKGTVLCVPGDAPLLPPDLAARLAVGRADADIAYVHDGTGPQPLCCLLDAWLLADLRVYLDAGGRTPHQWIARHRAIAVDYRDWPDWAWSVNTPEEWHAAERHLHAQATAWPR